MNPSDIFKGIKGIVKSQLADKIVSDAVFQERKAICNSCDLVVYKDDNKEIFKDARCGKCQCWLKYKLRIKDESCALDFPDKKWFEVK